MKARLINLWEEVTSSYWFVPSLLALSAGGLSVLTLLIDRTVGPDWVAEAPWVWDMSADGARELLSTAAGSTITVAGVVFSITIVALSLASSQFGPRLLRQFMRSRTNQFVLGIFVATFIYCMLILRTVRGEDVAGGAFIPFVSVLASLVLVLISLAVLIFFIHHTALAVQAPVVIADVAGDLLEAVTAVKTVFPAGIGREPRDEQAARGAAAEKLQGASRPVVARGNGYLLGIDDSTIMRTAAELDLVLCIKVRPGHFVARDMPVLRAWPAERVNDEAVRKLQAAFILGQRRTQTQDVEFTVDQLVEVAVRALSPSLNDPFTAMGCIDWLSAALRELATRPLPSAFRCDEAGRLRVIAEHPETFAGLLNASYDLIRQNARESVPVSIRLLEGLAAVAESQPRPEVRQAIARQARLIERGSREAISEPEDLADVDSVFRRVIELLEFNKPA